MSTLKSDCRKFSPNVFNKAKCQNCFRTKDAHSAEALENNRASRNISKCGYLFVAPDWDFNVTINRTKRWQRRWFKLFDDGELTYALDEFPDTIPQGTIDMNKVLEVSDAESVTGNDFAIAITTPEKVHFIKGTSKEESKWWFDVLSKVLPRQLSRAKHKRNATFPCGKATIPTTAVIAQEYCSEDDMRLTNYEPRPIRPKFLSTSELTTERDKTWMGDGEEDDVFPPDKREVELQNALNKLISQPDDEESDGQTNHQEEKAPKDYLSQLEELDARRRNRRYLKRENRIQRSQRSRVDGVSKMLPPKKEAPPPTPNGSAMAAAEKLEYLESINTSDDRANTPSSEQGKTSPSASPKSTLESRQNSLKTNLRKSESLKNIPSEAFSEGRDRVSGLRRYHSFKGSSSHRKIKSSSSTPRSKTYSSTLPRSASSTPISKSLVHHSSTPKINLEANKSPSPDITYEHTNDGVFTRTGWLMRQTLSKDWSRHWFVLKDSSLSYYRDPSAEHCGIMDGILDLNQVSTIRETSSDRYCAFSLLMWDGKKHVLAAETEDFRNMWIQALQYASNLWSSASKEDFICSEIVLPEHSFHHSDRIGVSPPSSLSSLAYGNNLMDTSTSSSDDQSEYFSLVDEDEVSELSSSPRTLPPSPPVNRTMMSLVKEKSRSRCSSTPKTSAQASGLDFPPEDNDHDARRGVDLYADSGKNTEFKDTSRSLQHSDSFHQLMNGENLSSTTLASSTFGQQSDEGENLQFKIELKNPSPKHDDEEVSRDSELRTPVKNIRSECSNTSTPEPETSDECRKCTSVKNKLVAAKEEIRKLKKELKEAHASFDNLEMASYKLAQDIKVKEENYNSQISLMTAKIDDLTSKFSIAEKNYRQLKQKTLKSEGKERKRSSLKSREGLTLTKEYEQKLCDLEKKIGNIEAVLSPESIETSEAEVKPSADKTEDVSVPSESSDTSTSTELPSNSSKGLFSRLQSLGSKVQNFDTMLDKSKPKIEPEKPKICLESRDGEVSRDILDMPDDWWATTFNTSIKNLNKYIEDHPTNLSECQNVFVKKIVKIMRWLKNSLESICKVENNKNSCLRDDKILQLQNLVDVVNATVTPKDPVPSNQWDACFTVWMAFEVMKSLNKIDSVDTIETLVKCDIAESAFKVITKTLCIALAEYKNSKLVNVIQLLSDIPQVHYFSPFFSKLFPQSEPLQFDSVSEALQQLSSQSSTIFSSLQEAKEIRYESLWNTLTEVPVQDANTNKPQPANSILNYATSVATNIHNIAELQLTNSQHQTSHMLLTEQDRVRRWCSETGATLKKSLANFLEELKDQCPMIYESTVSLSDLSNATRQEITSSITELSFLSVVFSVLNRLLRYDDPHENGYKPEISPVELDEHLRSVFSHKSRFLSNSDFFECPQCTVLNDFVTNSSIEMNWSDYVLEYHRHKPVRFDLLLVDDFGVDSGPKTTSSCANCDSKPSSETSTGISSGEVCNGDDLSCSECDEWIKKFCASERNHELERQAMELKHNQELQQLEECLIKSSEVHEQEMLQKENELAIATTQLQCLKTEYEAQISTLKNLYEQKLQCDSYSIDEDSIRLSYKIEMEDLKDMFKKGLLAIESSHRRITAEMEKRHKDEISALKAEKEKALELEAQATKTALEVIQKSHDQKLVEEKALIRKDLFKEFQNKKECEDLFCKYGNDLEKLKTEILTITDLYSAKCLENVALEEKVNSLRRQLDDAHTELCDLLTKNKDINIESNTL